MKRYTFLILVILLTIPVYSQVATAPSAGNGTEGDPYQIANLENLYWIAADSTNWDDHYIQTADINAADTRNWFSGWGWVVIGDRTKPFSGTYNGQMFFIDSLFAYRPYEQYSGMFGYTDNAVISKLILTNIDLYTEGFGYDELFIGGIVGYASGTLIDQCSTTGLIAGDVESWGGTFDVSMGGIVGKGGTIFNSYSTCIVKRISISYLQLTGGLVGSWGVIDNCFSAGKVTADHSGGLTGRNSSHYNDPLVNFWDVETTDVDSSDVGIGLTTSEMRDKQIYLDAGWDFVGETANGSEDIWDMNTTDNFGYPFFADQSFPAEPVVVTWGAVETGSNAEVKSFITGIGDSDIIQHGICWNFTGDPTLGDNFTEEGPASVVSDFISVISNTYSGSEYYIRSYAYNSNGLSYGNVIKLTTESYIVEAPSGIGTIAEPYEISSLGNLLWISDNKFSLDSNFVLTDDIDAYDTKNWNGGKGWVPIGDGIEPFSGVFDGASFNIDHLYINDPDDSFKGLFGVIDKAELKNINITQANVKGKGSVGILAGISSNSIIDNCFTSGTLEGEYYVGGLIGESSSDLSTCRTNVEAYGSKIGGLVGYNRGIISQSCSRGLVIGDDIEDNMTGGLVGWNISEIDNCFSSSDVNDAGAGGLVGFNDTGSMIRNSFNYGTVSGRQSGGLVGFLEYKNDSENSFWDVEISNTDSSATGNGLTTAEMKTMSTFTNAGWDFVGESTNGTEDIWDIDGVTNNGYPFLAWQETSIDNGQFTIYNYSLEQNYPNPFNPVTTIRFSIPHSQDVKLSVYNSNGQLVKTLINEKLSMGNHSALFDAKDLNSGIYFYTLQTDDKKLSNKMLLIK